MNKRSSFSRIDEQVFFTMGGLILIALIVLAFRVATRTTCAPVTFTAGEGPHITGSNITLKAQGTQAASYAWDFGDGTPRQKGTATMVHTYKSAGKYTVTLEVDGSCSAYYDLYVKDRPVRLAPPSEIGFLGQEIAYANQLITFTDTAAKHTSWEWHADESEPVSSYEKSASFKYTTEGPKKVWVKVNGKDVLYKYVQILEDPAVTEARNRAKLNRPAGGDRRVVVAKKESDEPPLVVSNPDDNKKEEPVQPAVTPEIKYPQITGTEMGNYLLEYADEKKQEAFFSKYFCGAVSVEYDNKFMSFPEFLAKIKNMRRIKSISVELTQEANNCVKQMRVRIKRRLL